jgi:hypothetical protein
MNFQEVKSWFHEVSVGDQVMKQFLWEIFVKVCQ